MLLQIARTVVPLGIFVRVQDYIPKSQPESMPLMARNPGQRRGYLQQSSTTARRPHRLLHLLTLLFLHCLAINGQQSCFPAKVFGRGLSSGVGEGTRVYVRKQYDIWEARYAYMHEPRGWVQIGRFEIGVENGPIFCFPLRVSVPARKKPLTWI